MVVSFKKKDELIVIDKAIHPSEVFHLGELTGNSIQKNNDEYIGNLAAIVASSDDAIISKLLDGIL